MIINNIEVKEEKTNKGIEYGYFACDCKDENKKFLDDLYGKYKNSKFPLSEITALLCDYGWHVCNIYNDQWYLVNLRNEEGTATMRIQCDKVEHGLSIAILIAENENK